MRRSLDATGAVSGEGNAGRGLELRIAIAFVALAILFGPIASYAAASFEAAVRWQLHAGGAVVSTIAGCVLLAAGVGCGGRVLNLRQGLAVGALLVPRVLELLVGNEWLRPWLHESPGGVELLIAVAAPLSLGLLAAVGAVSVDVPRVVIAAGIAGVGAVLLVIPTDTYAMATNQAPMLGLQVLIGMVTVIAWSFARQRLVGVAVLTAAGLFLLLNAGVSCAASLLTEWATWQPINWRDAAVQVLMQAGLAAVTYWLWFYLLVRMRLTGFSMYPLAAWTAATVGELALVRFAAWRNDLAVAIALGAIAMAVRARLADEQPTLLGLGDT